MPSKWRFSPFRNTFHKCTDAIINNHWVFCSFFDGNYVKLNLTEMNSWSDTILISATRKKGIPKKS